VKAKGLDFIDAVAKSEKPFFVGIAPIGPHAEFTGSGPFTKPVGATRHQKLFLDAKAPRTSNWNPDEVRHVKQLLVTASYLSCSRVEPAGSLD
jgi:N-acetylglucosamine-6-sulfatase